jgi:glycosyltransferase involved in cell wall biosynthesis
LIKLSVVIITYNEERNIGRCLESVKAIADDITVVDSLSTDKTKTICESYNVHFVEHAFEGHIRQKNFAAMQAKYPHQLSLDADEALSEELQNSIKQAKENWQADGYRMNRRSNYCGQWINHSGWYPDTKIRLYDIRQGQWGGMDPHDKIEMKAGTKTDFLEGDILHYTYYTIDEHVSQANKFSSIAARALIERGKPVYFAQLFIKPIAKFIRNYILRLGFLDGFYGFIICQGAAHETFLKYAKAWQLKKKRR